MSLILFVAVALAFAVEEWIEGGVIGAIIILNTVVGFLQVRKKKGRERRREGRQAGRYTYILPILSPSFLDVHRSTARSRRCKPSVVSALLWPECCETGRWWR
jgi:magnesium-transporting ATPase (P-type)